MLHALRCDTSCIFPDSEVGHRLQMRGRRVGGGHAGPLRGCATAFVGKHPGLPIFDVRWDDAQELDARFGLVFAYSVAGWGGRSDEEPTSRSAVGKFGCFR